MNLNLQCFLISQNISSDLKGTERKIKTALRTMYGASFYGCHTAQCQLQ